ncbi:uncharacterized protein [Euphorbia lathyris]|uniref:uncharacterized protein n=1 Tax=Euphorbia lathyris TaxID=212925 RepID=UPI00331345AC
MAEDDLDSLFEGMVLFTPQLVDDQNHNQHQDDPPHDNDSSSTHDSQSHLDVSTPTSNDLNSVSSSQPLDENIFSDLTVQTLTPLPDPIPSPTSSPPISRQVSRKKKKASTLRVGYARDVSLPLHDQSPSLHHRAASDDTHSPQPDLNDSPSPMSATTSANGDVAQMEITADSIVTQLSMDDEELDPAPDLEPSSNSKEDQFERIKVLISEKLQSSRQLAASVSEARKEAIRKRRKATEELNSASSKHKDLELQLEAACEAEDFEVAQRISDSLATADEERQALLAVLREAEAQCDAIDSKMQDVLDSQILAEEECATLLSSFAKDAESDADSIVREAQMLASKEMDEWFSSIETLEAKKVELDIQSHFINEARQTVDDSIEHSIENFRKEQQDLHSKKDILTDELHKLLALVREKEKEIAENDTKIKGIEERIADVVSGFQENQSSIDSTYYNLQSEISQMNLQDDSLSTKRKEIDEFIAQEEGRGAKLRELAKASEEEAKTYKEAVELRKSLMVSIVKSREDKVRLAKTEEKLIEDVQMLQQEVSSARASLQELSSTKSNIQQTVASFKQRIFFIDKRIPELEAEKKVAASARNFKEAARVAAEAKSLSVEKDGVLIDLERAMSDVEKVEEDIKNTISRLQETEQLISSKEKELGMAKFQRLLLIAGSATAERSAALELSDIEEASLLLAEAEAATAEAKKLQPIYDLKEEEFPYLPKHFISMELVSNLGGEQLAELAESVNVSATQ